VNVDAIPAELREQDRWVIWRWGETDPKTGKRKKPPYRAAAPNRHASSTKPDTWGTFEQAVKAMEAGKADGIGYAACPPHVFVDLDDGLSEADQGAVMVTLDSYSERSPSGTGYHVILRADLNGHGRHPQGIGVFQEARFFYFTGSHVQGTPKTIEERQAQLEDVLARFLPAPEPSLRKDTLPAQPVELDDRELLDVAMRARNGAKFERLWNGDTTGHGDDDSAADLALCNMLAFYTGRDPDRIDRMFRASGLVRAKWDRDDYRQRTIATAIAATTEIYQPGNRTPRTSNGPAPQLDEWGDEVTEGFVDPIEDIAEAAPDSPIGGTDDPSGPFEGLTHDQVLELRLPEERFLIAGLIPRGAVGTIAGVPETHKSFLAQATATRCSAGAGEILGCSVTEAARVGYFWNDDSTREEAERVQLFQQVEQSPANLSLWWFLNKDVRLPRDISRLRATVEALALELLILDSFYNFAAGDLKDDDAEKIVALLKREISDPTGCTVLIVDHMPWATDTNRQRLRAYGGVFKSAATRFGIYIDAVGKNLSIEARGNNIRGFKKHPAYWDEESLELRLIDVQRQDEEALDAEVASYVEEHPGESTKAIASALEKRRENVSKALERLQDPGRLNPVNFKTSRELGRSGTGKYWFPHNHAGSEASQLFGNTQDTRGAESSTDGEVSKRSRPLKGDASPDTHSLDSEIEADSADIPDDSRAREEVAES
jgi:putative DNA primase/helicase